ncbi:Rho termination factor N-terminal domain-containing protein [Brevibacillus choshinensis]|uniref:Rho termination factor N-terminal domain-containing protein n=1 Tax=Brevibacillus choshinensis TaxID=54911 RepID=UPI002E2121B9|nr:Rho termination factor N-terminal domain-containing protein [Brevibacillus choshinensis]
MDVKVKYKHETGALHIGSGRFFYAGETYSVSNDEWEHLQWHEDLVEVEEVTTSNPQVALDKYTVDELKVMAKDAGIEITTNMKKADIVAALEAIEVNAHADTGESKSTE